MNGLLVTRLARPAARYAAVVHALLGLPIGAQSRDSTRVVTDSVARVERVLVTAFRGAQLAPIAETTLIRAEITQRHFGQDVPLLLAGATPSLTAHTETGTNWGYSYLRLRGMDQTRVNITIDGIPLNDMEDQVLYFANFADLMSSVQSVQVQRGVGTSSAGTASFAGSMNFETMPLARRTRGGEVQLQAGSFGARRVSGAFHTGLLASRLALQGRAGALRTNGYREHSGVSGGSALLGAGWFGDRDLVKLTALAGMLADTLSYVGATREELSRSRRFNPLAPDERDRFGQQLVSLALTRVVSQATSFNATLYRNSASGSYDYADGADRYRFNLDHRWYGVTSAVNHVAGNAHLNAGVNANSYVRDHRGYFAASTTLYENAGRKQDVSGFVKASWDAGSVRWFGDLQARAARFRYLPDAQAGISARQIGWVFVSPKLGATWSAGHGIRAYASYGLTSREPARSDLLAGEDDLNAGNVDDYGDFTRVRPESVRDLEVGVNVTRRALDLAANLFAMHFHNDIARIGAPTASGAILRRNVGASYRRGVELDAAWRPAPRLTIGGTAAWSANRIRIFTDSSRGTPIVRRNVEPLLSPRVVSAQRVQYQATPSLSVSMEGRYQSRAFLDNTSSADRVLPAFYVLDAAARLRRDRAGLSLRGVNLGDSQRFGSGSVSSSGTVRYFVLAGRSVFVTLEIGF